MLYWEDESIKDPVEKLKSRKTAVRDIAQFVRFNDLHELATVEVAENLLPLKLNQRWPCVTQHAHTAALKAAPSLASRENQEDNSGVE